MSIKIMTPGVYIEEKGAFPNSIIEVETAIPAFIGYTEKASRKSKSLLNRPTRITSLMEYVELFGEDNNPRFKLALATANSRDTIEILGKKWAIDLKATYKTFFYNSIRLFYANGGSTCYIVSVGTCDDNQEVKLNRGEMLDGLEMLEKEQEPTMVVVPEAVNLPMEDCYEVYVAVLRHCCEMQNRIGILDVHEGYKERESDVQSDKDVINSFRMHIGSENLMYGAAYYPWLETNIVQNSEVSLENLDESVDLAAILPESAVSGVLENTAIDRHTALLSVSPTYVELMQIITEKLNLLPPSSAMAGLYTMVDNNRGVWKAPANISINNVIKPAVNITHEQQEILNVDAISGKSINAIRTFQGIGTLVWGGRTLDGNSLDWKYINVRRTMIMLEQSIKLALRAYVFEPNDANTWVTVKSMIVNFLTDMWKKGALAGSSPDDAFAVNVGLGSTMTAIDILEGKMNVTVKVAVTRPAEFIVVTFQQQMQKS